jgi:hypothetical protein
VEPISDPDFYLENEDALNNLFDEAINSNNPAMPMQRFPDKGSNLQMNTSSMRNNHGNHMKEPNTSTNPTFPFPNMASSKLSTNTKR